jgi:hypothetical protein
MNELRSTLREAVSDLVPSGDEFERTLRRARRRRRRSRLVAMVTALAVAAAGTGIAVWAFSGEPRNVGPASSPEPIATVTIDPRIGETFAPAPPSAHPSISAQEAWAQYATLNGSKKTTIPADVSVRLGLLTIPLGGPSPYPGEGYTARDELTWGYSHHSCPVVMGGFSPPPNPCIEWLFLDANSGHMIEDTWQMTFP